MQLQSIRRDGQSRLLTSLECFLLQSLQRSLSNLGPTRYHAVTALRQGLVLLQHFPIDGLFVDQFDANDLFQEYHHGRVINFAILLKIAFDQFLSFLQGLDPNSIVLKPLVASQLITLLICFCLDCVQVWS